MSYAAEKLTDII